MEHLPSAHSVFPGDRAGESSPFYQDIAAVYKFDDENSSTVFDVRCVSARIYARMANGWRVLSSDETRWDPSDAPMPRSDDETAAPPALSPLLMLSYSESDRLPVPDIRCFFKSKGEILWIGASRGVARRIQGAWRYYAGRRWLPHDRVNALALDDQERLWAATDGGLACIASVPTTLERKAEHYESITAARHNRDGFVAACRLEDAEDLHSGRYEATDNDGLWTSLYLCAECFRWAVTGDPRALELARRSMQALLRLVEITSIPGFPARALIRRGERVLQSDPGPNWYAAPSDPDVLYKNDTSSDEIDGHYLAWYIYSKFATCAKEKEKILETCRSVTHHILDNDYTLVGPTGKPTRWGVWSPAKLNHDPDWQAERGLNSLEILSHLQVAYHLCGDARFHNAYRDLIDKHGYAHNTLNQKIVPPDGENNHSDDELAACAYYPLLQLETDPELRLIYLESLERTHSVLRWERSPFYNVIYSACTGKPFDKETSLEWFRDAPWDLRDWRMTNSHRADVEIDPAPGRFGEVQLTRVLPPGERSVGKWNHNPFAADTGTDGTSEEDGAFWLLPYWMGRYHNLI